MNSPASRQGNIVRYIVYILGYLMVLGAMKLALLNKETHLWSEILFGIVSLMIFIFYTYRFNREERFFEKNDFKFPWLNNYRYIILMTILFVGMRVLISYLQAKGIIPHLKMAVQIDNSKMFWLIIIGQGVVLSILQQFIVNGFLFNYYFRTSSPFVGLLGMITSGLLFVVVNYQAQAGLAVIYFVIGVLISWSYLYTQSLIMPIYLAVLNGVLAILLL